MTTTFEDRERGYENKFAHDQEIEFRISARMAKLLGAWAAEKIKLEGTAAENYAHGLVELVVKKNFKDLLVNQLQQDFTNSGIEINAKSIESEIQNFLEIAEKQITKAG